MHGGEGRQPAGIGATAVGAAGVEAAGVGAIGLGATGVGAVGLQTIIHAITTTRMHFAT